MKCPKCGKEIADDSIYCEYCGTKLENAASVSPEQKNHSKSRTTLWMMILAMLLVVIVGGVVIYNQYNKPTVVRMRCAEEPEKYAEGARFIAQDYVYVDLGLPSGTLWKYKNEEDGLYSYDQAMAKFGNNLPTKEQLEELKNSCSWMWNGSGYKVTGPSGESITLPAAGIRNRDGSTNYVGSYGYYWSSTPDGSEYAWHLCFFPSVVGYMGNFMRCYGLSVRLVQNPYRKNNQLNGQTYYPEMETMEEAAE